MTSKLLVPCLVTLKAEIDAIWPDRPRGADGDIGDAAHQQRVSDHNDDEVGAVPIHDADHKHEVHALDITTFAYLSTLVLFLVNRCRQGVETRLRYIIWNRTIWHIDNGWRAADYHGTDPHTGHAHFSASYRTDYEADISSWHLEDIPVALTDDDKKWLAALLASWAADVQVTNVTAVARAVHNQKIGRSEVTIGQALQNINNDVTALTDKLLETDPKV